MWQAHLFSLGSQGGCFGQVSKSQLEKLRWHKAEALLFSSGFGEFYNAFIAAATCPFFGEVRRNPLHQFQLLPTASAPCWELGPSLCKFQLLRGVGATTSGKFLPESWQHWLILDKNNSSTVLFCPYSTLVVV